MEIINPALDKQRLLVLGNGFDLDLGYKTSYQDFFINENTPDYGEFPFVKGGCDYHSLGKFVLECAERENWYDLENVLAEYGHEYEWKNYSLVINGVSIPDPISTFHNRRRRKAIESPKQIEDDLSDYLLLVERLKQYLKTLDLSMPNKKSVAARLLTAISDDLLPPSIYSFNYTNLVAIGEALGIHVIAPYYVHGSLENNDIILGVGDYALLRSSCDYLYKTSNHSYKSTSLLYALDTCDEVYIFGLSLSPVDYPYFEDFFRKIASGAYGEARKFIRIFTLDDSSRSVLLQNLRKMNQGMIKLNGYSDFDIIRTKDNVDEEKVRIVLERLSPKWEVDLSSTL